MFCQGLRAVLVMDFNWCENNHMMCMMLKLVEFVLLTEIVADDWFSGLNCWIKKPSLMQSIVCNLHTLTV